MDSRADYVDDNINMSLDICSGRLPRANFDFCLVQHAELDRAKREKTDRDLSKSFGHYTANAKHMDLHHKNATRSS